MKPPLTTDIPTAVSAIVSGRVVAVPTGTAYCLAADALQGFAIQRVRNLKNRPAEKAFTVFLHDDLWDDLLDLTPQERSLLQQYKNKPLTLLVTPRDPLLHMAQDGKVGLRVIDHPLMAEVAQACMRPLTATSANVSGQPACYDPGAIQQAFPWIVGSSDTIHGDTAPAGPTTYDMSLAYVLDGGSLPKQQPTTIARLSENKVEIIRPGAITEADLTEAIRKL